jgi:outer membrane receptor protein involved in Fe transport
VSAIDDQGTRVQPTVELRGFSLSPVVGTAQGVSVFLDGVRVNEPDAQELNFDLLPMDAVETAELIRGPATLFGKNSLAGALVLSTARGSASPRLEASTELGGSGYRAARMTASGLAHGYDGYVLARASDEDGYRLDTGARTRMLFATIGYREHRSDVAMSLLLAHDRLSQAGSLPESWLSVNRRANYTPGDFFEPDLASITMRGQRQLLDGDAELRASLFARRNNTEQFNVNVGNPSARALVGNRSVGGTAEVTRFARLAAALLTLSLGGELSANRVQYRIFQVATADAGVEPTCDTSTGLCEEARVDETDGAAYAQAVLELPRGLAVTASARADGVRIPFRDLRTPANDGTSTFWRVSPRFGASYRLDDRLRVYASMSSAFRAPAPLELACADAAAPCPLPFALGEDPALAPVTVWNYEGGLSWQPIGAVLLDLVGYRAEVHNEILFVSSQTAAGYFKNLPRTRRTGIELSAQDALPYGLRAQASYVLVNATYRSDVQLASAIPDAAPARPGNRFPLTPVHRGTGSFGMTRLVGNLVLDAELSGRAVSSQFLRGDEGNKRTPLPAYGTADLRIGVEHARLSATLHATNLLDSRYTTFGVYGVNPLGPIGGPRPATPTLERFLTPGYPRTLTLTLRAGL